MTMLQKNTTTGSRVNVVTRLIQGVSDCKSTSGPRRSPECSRVQKSTRVK